MNYRDAGLTDEEYSIATEMLGREPNELETALVGVMWSEHCSYKSTRPLLETFPQEGRAVVEGQGENAGVVDCSGGWGLAFKVESHNHPSAIAPYQGAATGVGGIIRDILAMGARPAASMDGLFLAPSDGASLLTPLADGIVEGIAGYGNAVGVPTIGGKTFFDPRFEGNPLVNAFCAGFVRLDEIVSSRTAKPGDLAILLGSATGRDGVSGASFASRELDDDGRKSRPQIQIGDPFEEKLLIECCLELKKRGLIESMQDMGAAGIISSSSEIAHKSGVGMEIYCEKIPLRETMEPWEIFLSESQERMLLVVNPERADDVKTFADRYGLECATIGRVTSDDRYVIRVNGEQIANLPVEILGAAPVINWESRKPADAEVRRTTPDGMRTIDPERELVELISSPQGCSRSEIWERYDCEVQLGTVEWPGARISAVRVPETDSIVAFSMEADPWKCHTDPFFGACEAMALSLRTLYIAGAEPLGMTNCLNFPSPENPENFFELSECVRGLATVCRDASCPVVSGNVSLYNETPNGGIYPTPLVVTAGLLTHRSHLLRSGTARDGDSIYAVGSLAAPLGATRWQMLNNKGWDAPRGATVEYDARMEKKFARRALDTAHKVCAGSARAIAGGGLAAALAQEAVATGLGASLSFEKLPDAEGCDGLTRVLFGEGGPRAIYFVPHRCERTFLSVWDGYPIARLGSVGGNCIRIENVLRVEVSKLTQAFTRSAV